MRIYFDFPFFLTATVLITGIIILIDKLFFAAKRKASNKTNPWYVEYSISFFPVLLIVLIIRSFIVQPYRVPTGSLEPTILPGDFIIVNQFAYGLRLPVINKKIWSVGEPKLGDIALFRWPNDPSILFIKRVIGTPGDHISYHNKILSINGKKIRQEDHGLALDEEGFFPTLVYRKTEYLTPKLQHEIFLRKDINNNESFDIVVPPNQYFMMGDNRDASDDSRDWGFVPEENLVGKAFGTWMSWDTKKYKVKWERIGKAIH